MLLKLPNVSTPCVYSNPTNKLLTNAIVDAVDSSAAAIALYPHAYTATLRSDLDNVVYNATDTTLTLDTTMKVALGVFLSNTSSKNQLFHVTGSVSFLEETANAGSLVYFVFGQTDAATITQSDAGASNLLSNYIVLPRGNTQSGQSGNVASPGQYVYYGINELVWMDNSFANTDPVCFAAVIHNNVATSASIDMPHIYLSIRNASASIIYETSGGV